MFEQNDPAYRVEMALLDAGIIPERFLGAPDPPRTTGRAGVFRSARNDRTLLRCEAEGYLRIEGEDG